MKAKYHFIVACAAMYGASQFAHAQCPQICDTNENTSLGESALLNNTGLRNTGLGFQALQNNNGNSNTAIGVQALSNNTNGSANTAVGYVALPNNTTGNGNTAVGVAALLTNTSGKSNTAVGFNTLKRSTATSANTAIGFQALQKNTVGGPNTAVGYNALANNDGGGSNTATGHRALESNTNGGGNTASGAGSLEMNTFGESNTATGVSALNANTTGDNNSAFGGAALFLNRTGKNNTACGYVTLYNNTNGDGNTATGQNALLNNTTGNNNIALGINAGINLTTGSANIDIGSPGVAGESNTIRIGDSRQTATYISGISGTTVAGGVGVLIDSNGHLGTNTSSARFKEQIKPMDKASEAILSLCPVTFRYKKELDSAAIRQFGLVAEDVAKTAPDLVARDEEGKPYTVRYEAVNAMLLNEFLKEHRKVEEQAACLKKQDGKIASLEATVAELSLMLEAQATQIEKVSARLATASPSRGGLEATVRAPEIVLNNQ